MNVIEPDSVPATWKGQLFHVKPMGLQRLAKFAKALKPVAGKLQGTIVLDMGFVLGMMADNLDDMLKAVSIATEIPIEELQTDDPERTGEVLEMVIVVLKVNADFFKGRLTPAILGAVKKVLAPVQPGAGPIQ